MEQSNNQTFKQSNVQKRLIVIGGPTAAGKTAIAIQLAKHFQTEIISADSRQFYRGLDIGTAKATAAEQAEVKHHFIDFQDITQDYSIGDFERDALSEVHKIFEKNNFAIMVGGSGMYIRALCEGLDAFPEVSNEIRENLEKWHEELGLEHLQNLLKEKDEESYNSLDIQNPNRVKRALGVCLASEKPFSFYKNQPKQTRDFTPIYIALDLPREFLYDRINRRVDAMIAEGLEKEARTFLPFKEKNALQTVGYQEFFEYFENKITLARANELIKQHTRNYAKRQLTWFRNQANFTFFLPEKIDEIIEFVNSVNHDISPNQ